MTKADQPPVVVARGFEIRSQARLSVLCIAWTALLIQGAHAEEEATVTPERSRPPVAPDIREDETPLKVQKGDLVVVPIPFSNPTLNSGIVVGGAYFYPQTEEQKAAQPASVTAAAGMYSSSKSSAFGIGQQNYWDSDRWRFTGLVGAADLRLQLLAPDEDDSRQEVAWHVRGNFLYALLSRRFWGDWYAGVSTRYVDIQQEIAVGDVPEDFDSTDKTRTAGLGVNFEYDVRDMPMNPYSGRYFQAKALFNDERIGSNSTYQSYQFAYRSYHTLTDSLVLAWEVGGCKKTGFIPLWDACRINLRGFSATDYMGKQSARGQAEARWKLSKRWGLVGFAGAGYLVNVYNGEKEREPIPSYGVGVRFMVLQAKRINFRVDYARSNDSDAVYVSVGEAF